jgi:hypothetical protein
MSPLLTVAMVSFVCAAAGVTVASTSAAQALRTACIMRMDDLLLLVLVTGRLL